MRLSALSSSLSVQSTLSSTAAWKVSRRRGWVASLFQVQALELSLAAIDTRGRSRGYRSALDHLLRLEWV